MSKFFKGFLFGIISTISAIAGALYAFHRIVVQPIEDQENRASENRRRAQRKQRSAHNN
ncbi:DUF3042 family protein [Pediococcus argentinicus]|uniref:DUF3042 domain-containing protein n=1 Tax=Pediococcus argentinicus TaxID=480391 RepID=A0A0R2NHV9_9LACO|nr:DUF3042 family protein [Pediococcus argentinicus]KRO25391.1 hypothetical protein IV88_GL000228 [Pediococcus argentinicus]NKZ22309.1 DUF3042 family protein [Pediococcus argentinicus]GEP19326.1 DUF3042 domain-containing protein [Pediococcus argentinicus]